MIDKKDIKIKYLDKLDVSDHVPIQIIIQHAYKIVQVYGVVMQIMMDAFQKVHQMVSVVEIIPLAKIVMKL